MSEKLQKIISARGVTSRRRAEELIQAGRVTCNGLVCQLGDRADPEADTICIDGKPLPSPGGNVYLMLHKPRGYVTTLSDEKTLQPGLIIPAFSVAISVSVSPKNCIWS